MTESASNLQIISPLDVTSININNKKASFCMNDAQISVDDINLSDLKIEQFRNLKQLSIEKTSNFPFNQLSECRDLRVLSIKDDEITDDQLAVVAELPKLTSLTITNAPNLTGVSGIEKIATTQALHTFANTPEYHDILKQIKKTLADKSIKKSELHPFLEKTGWESLSNFAKYIKMGSLLYGKVVNYYCNLYNDLEKKIPVDCCKLELICNILIFESLEKACKFFPGPLVKLVTTVWTAGNTQAPKQIRNAVSYSHQHIFWETLFEIKHSPDKNYSFDDWLSNVHRMTRHQYSKSLVPQNDPDLNRDTHNDVPILSKDLHIIPDLSKDIHNVIPQLNVLNISQVEMKTAESFKGLHKIPFLNVLNMENCNIGEKQTKTHSFKLPNASWINLGVNNVGDKGHRDVVCDNVDAQIAKNVLFTFPEFRRLIMYGFLIMLAEEFNDANDYVKLKEIMNK